MNRELYKFLLRRFEPRELLRIVAFDLREIRDHLPDANHVTRADFTSAVVQRLEEHELVSGALFDALHRARPNLREEIEALRSGSEELRVEAPRGIEGPVVVGMVAANPRDTTPLCLDEEHYRVDQALRTSSRGRAAQLQPLTGATLESLRELIRSYNPAVLHFSGHGASDGSLLFEDGQGFSLPLDGEALAAWLATRDERPHLLVMNACFGARNSLPLTRYIDVVVGMTREVLDDAARTFSYELYRELGEGGTIDRAFDSARSAVAMSHRGQEVLLRLNTRAGVRADQLRIFR